MQCPNCRNIENGEWRRFEEAVYDSDMDNFIEEIQVQQQIIEMENLEEHWCPYHGWVIALPAVSNQDAQVPSSYATIHQQPAPSQVPEVSVSNISMNHLNQAHVPYVTVRDNVIGANRAPVRANLLAPQEYCGVLPYNQAVNHRTTVQPRNRYNGMQSMQGVLRGRYVSAPMSSHQTRNFYRVPRLNLNTQNNHTHRAIHRGHVLNSTIRNNLRTAPVYYLAPSLNEVNDYQIFERLSDSTDPYRDLHD